MTDELFDYFGKGSKKFEPLDDDLDLPEVSPKRRDDAEEETTAELEPVKASAQPVDDIALPADTDTDSNVDDDDDVFAGFGAGLFDASTDELPPRKQVAKAKPSAAEAKQVVSEKSKPEASPRTTKAKPAAPKPVTQEVASSDPSDESDDSEGGAWDFIAGVLGIGGKKTKSDDDGSGEDASDDTQLAGNDSPVPVTKSKRQAAASNKDQPEADVKSFFQEPKPASEKAVDALFDTADDGLDLAGWGDDDDEAEVETPVAAKPPKAERPSQPGRGRKPSRAKEDRDDRGRAPRAQAPIVDDIIDDDIDEDDENFIEFEVEELTPSARDKKDAPSGDRPRRRRRPVRESNEEDSVSDDAPRSRTRSDRDDAPSESRSGGRGRSRGRGRERNQSKDRDTRSSETVAKVDSDSGDDDWRDDKPEADSDLRSERSRGSRGRGRGRKRPERQARDSKPFEDDSLDDDLEISSFVDDDDVDTDTGEAPKKPRRSRRPRSRSRGRSRNDNDRDDDVDQDSPDLDALDLDSPDDDSSDHESQGRGSSGRSRRGRRPRGDRDRDSESSPRRGRGSRDSRDRDDSRDDKPPVYPDVPTWDETIESMIESNIKNHESGGGGRGRGGGGRGRGGGGRNSNSRNRR